MLVSADSKVNQPHVHISPFWFAVCADNRVLSSSLCARHISSWLPILHTVVYMCQYQFPWPPHAFPHLCPSVCSVHCFADRFICTIFKIILDSSLSTYTSNPLLSQSPSDNIVGSCLLNHLDTFCLFNAWISTCCHTPVLPQWSVPTKGPQVKTGWIQESYLLATQKLFSYLLISLFLPQPPILNSLVQVLIAILGDSQIPPIHHGNSSSPVSFPLKNPVLFFLIQLFIMLPSVCFVYDNSPPPVSLPTAVGHCVLFTCPYPITSITFSHFHFSSPLFHFFTPKRLKLPSFYSLTNCSSFLSASLKPSIWCCID